MKLRLRDIVKESWKQLKSNIKFLIPLFLAIIIFSLIIGWFGGDDVLSISGILSLLLTPVVYFVTTKVAFKISKGEKPGWNKLFEGLNQKTYLAFLAVGVFINIATILIAIIGGFISSLIPLFGPIAFLLLMILILVTFIGVIFFPYFRLIDHGGDFWSSIKYSFNLAKNKRAFLVKFLIFAFVLNLAGILVVGVGLLITIPLTSIIMANIYQKLKAN